MLGVARVFVEDTFIPGKLITVEAHLFHHLQGDLDQVNIAVAGKVY